jgi:hypothetical protein
MTNAFQEGRLEISMIKYNNKVVVKMNKQHAHSIKKDLFFFSSYDTTIKSGFVNFSNKISTRLYIHVGILIQTKSKLFFFFYPKASSRLPYHFFSN